MIVLSIETATDGVGVALADEAGVRASSWSTGRRHHAESLAPSLLCVLAQAGVGLGEVGAVAVDIGPGLFTGIRVGVASAQGIARGEGIGIVGVSSLDVLARMAFDACWPGDVVTVVDARRGEVFATWYGRAPADAGVAPSDAGGARSAPRVSAPGDLASALGSLLQTGRWPQDRSPGSSDPSPSRSPQSAPGGPATPPRGVLVVGNGARRYGAILGAVPGVEVAGPHLGAPDPGVLATMGVERAAAGGDLLAPAAVRPLYLRAPDARANWAQRTVVMAAPPGGAGEEAGP